MVKILQKNGEIVVKGIIINHHFKKLSDYIEDYAQTNQSIKLNLKELEFIDGKGAKKLMALFNGMKQQGRDIEITNISERVMSRFIQLGSKVWLRNNFNSKVG